MRLFLVTQIVSVLLPPMASAENLVPVSEPNDWETKSSIMAKCIDQDNSSFFGPVRDQDGHGYCWSFMMSGLYEEQLCKANRSNCGKSVSPLDMSRCSWSLMTNNESGKIDSSDIFSKSPYCDFAKEGVCLEENAPYDPITDNSCSNWSLFSYIFGKRTFNNSVRCKNEKLAAMFEQYKNTDIQVQKLCSSGNINNSSLTNLLQTVKESQQATILAMQEYLPEEVTTSLALKELLNNNDSVSSFLQDLYIRKDCKENRFKLPVQASGTAFIPFNASYIASMQNFIADNIKNNSLGIALDMRTLDHLGLLSFDPNYGQHAVIISGMRQNKQSGKCELKIRNSWGKGADLDGWFDASKIIFAIRRMSYLEKLIDSNPPPAPITSSSKQLWKKVFPEQEDK